MINKDSQTADGGSQSVALWSFLVSVIGFVALGICGFMLWAGAPFSGGWLIIPAILAVSLLSLIWFDITQFRLPNLLTLPLLFSGLVVTMLGDPELALWHAGAAILAFLFFRLIDLVYTRLRGRAGLGAGDAKLFAAGIAWLGPVSIPLILLIGSAIAILYALILEMFLKDGQSLATRRIPFGVGLCFAIWCAYWFMPVLFG